MYRVTASTVKRLSRKAEMRAVVRLEEIDRELKEAARIRRELNKFEFEQRSKTVVKDLFSSI